MEGGHRTPEEGDGPRAWGMRDGFLEQVILEVRTGVN